MRKTILVLMFTLSWTALSAQVSIVPASPLAGPPVCRPFFIPAPPFCTAVPYDTSQNFAFSGNGFAQAAVALDATFVPSHRPEWANDGHYGNGSSWIGNSPNSWLKIDLGQVVLIDTLKFGRDRNGGFNDRDPGQFKIAVALAENVYADGDDSNDGSEYTQIFDSANFGFGGTILGSQTVQASFPPVPARFVKLTIQQPTAAIDEVEILGEVDLCPENPAPSSQGYWHRQCLGVPAGEGGIDPGRNGRGPESPTEPDFVPDLMDCADDALESLEGLYGTPTCEGMNADPANDPCQRAEKQLTALLLNVCSGRLSNGCDVDMSAEGCASTTVGDLVDEIATLILVDECNLAMECAAAVNEGDGLVDGGGGASEQRLRDRDRQRRPGTLRKRGR